MAEGQNIRRQYVQYSSNFISRVYNYLLLAIFWAICHAVSVHQDMTNK